MKAMQKLILAALMAISGVSLQGCTDFEVGAAVGGAVGVIIGSELGHHHHHHHHHYRRPNPPRYGRCYRRYCEELNVKEAGEINPHVVKVAKKYDIPLDSADVLVGVLYEAKFSNLDALADLGMTTEDLVAIYKNKNPSASALVKMSEALDLDLAATHELIQKMKTEIQQSRVIESIYPQY